MDICKEILDSQEITINRLLENASYDKTIPCTIVSVGESNIYNIKIDKEIYSVPNGTDIIFIAGNRVWVTIPCNNIKNMYISAKRK